MRKQCEFPDGCEQEGTHCIFYPFDRKSWMCVEHYDRMAAHYKRRMFEADPDPTKIDLVWCQTILKLNDW